MDYYEILGIKKNADNTTVRNAYIKNAKLYHPDKNIDKDGFNDNKFKEIIQAYEILSCPQKKFKYDLNLKKTSDDDKYHEVYNNLYNNIISNLDKVKNLDEKDLNCFMDKVFNNVCDSFITTTLNNLTRNYNVNTESNLKPDVKQNGNEHDVKQNGNEHDVGLNININKTDNTDIKRKKTGKYLTKDLDCYYNVEDYLLGSYFETVEIVHDGVNKKFEIDTRYPNKQYTIKFDNINYILNIKCIPRNSETISYNIENNTFIYKLNVNLLSYFNGFTYNTTFFNVEYNFYFKLPNLNPVYKFNILVDDPDSVNRQSTSIIFIITTNYPSKEDIEHFRKINNINESDCIEVDIYNFL